jgi:hypothetical protein
MKTIFNIMKNATKFLLGIICGTITAIIISTFIIDPILETQATEDLEPKHEAVAGYL